MKQKLMASEIIGGLAFFIVLTFLAYVAISERSISVGAYRSGSVSHASGDRAVWLGLFYLAMAFVSLGYVLRFTIRKALCFALLTAVWLGIGAWQLTGGF